MSHSILFLRLAAAFIYPVAVWFYIQRLFTLVIDFANHLHPKIAFTAGYFLDHLSDHLAVAGLALVVVLGLLSFALRQNLNLAEELLFQAATGILALGLAAFIALYALMTVASICILPTTATGFFLAAHLLVMAGLAVLARG